MCLFLPVLQKAQKKMLDVINSVGLSSSVLKMIERRHKNDLYMALGGMVCHDWLHSGCWSWVTAAVSGGSVPRTCCSGSSACSQQWMCSVLFGVSSFRSGLHCFGHARQAASAVSMCFCTCVGSVTRYSAACCADDVAGAISFAGWWPYVVSIR
jgi:hypothetical protein